MAQRTAAFYDLDGTLLNGTIVDHYLYFARSDPNVPSRVKRLLETALKAPYYKYVDSLDRHSFNQEFYRSYAGLSQDRLVVLGESLFENVLRHKMYAGVPELLACDREAGHIQVLVTGALEFVAKPAAKFLGIEHVVATRLEYEKNGLATGELRPPVIAGPEKARWIREFALEHDLDLDRSTAYADDAADLPMLSMVGRPVAVNPDPPLLATARSHRWPVLYTNAAPRTLSGKLRQGAWDAAKGLVQGVRDEAQLRGPRAGQWVGGLRDRLRTFADAARERAERSS